MWRSKADRTGSRFKEVHRVPDALTSPAVVAALCGGVLFIIGLMVFALILARQFADVARAIREQTASESRVQRLEDQRHALGEAREDITREIDAGNNRVQTALQQYVQHVDDARLAADSQFDGEVARLDRNDGRLMKLVVDIARLLRIPPEQLRGEDLEAGPRVAATNVLRPDQEGAEETVAGPATEPAAVPVGEPDQTFVIPAVPGLQHPPPSQALVRQEPRPEDTGAHVLRIQPATGPVPQPPMVDNRLREQPTVDGVTQDGRVIDPGTHDGRLRIDYRGPLVPAEGAMPYAALPERLDLDDALRGGRRALWEILVDLVRHRNLWEPYPRARGLLWYHHARALFMAQYGFALSWDILHEFPRLATNSDEYQEWERQNGVQR